MSTHFCRIRERGFIRISGADKISFLQGLITNDAKKLSSDNALYALLLSPQGKFLYDFFSSVIPGSDDILMDARKDDVPALLKKLTLYKLRSAVTLEDVSEQFETIAILGDLPSDSVPDNLMVYKDPRHPMMGMRATLPKSADMKLISGQRLQEIAEDIYERHRVSLGLAVGAKDMMFDESYPLHFGMDHFHAIDFNKGCYVGQEVTARTKHRGGIKKSIAIVTTKEIVAAETLARGTEIFLDEKLAGSLCSISTTKETPHFMALALLQTESLEMARSKKMPLIANGVTLEILES